MLKHPIALLYALALAAGLTVLTWPQLFDLQTTPIIAQIVALRGSAIAAALVIAVVSLLVGLGIKPLRRLTGATVVLMLLFAAANSVVLVSRGLGNSDFAAKTDQDITVLSWNTLGESTNPDTVAQLAIERDADVVMLPEATIDMADQIAVSMAESGLPMNVLGLSEMSSTSILISPDLGEYVLASESTGTSTVPTVIAEPLNPASPTFVAAHAVAPRENFMSSWRSDLAWLGEQCSGRNVVMAGDFNSTLDNMAGLGNKLPGGGVSAAVSGQGTLGNCIDSALLSGNAAVGTWPTIVPPLLGSPIDHVMATQNWDVSGMEIIQSQELSGSDHRPVVVQLTPAG